jgi:hypothetical protein
MAAGIIDTAVARQMIEGKAVQSASIIGQPGGWSVLIKLGATEEKALAAQRSKRVRLWRSLDRCVDYLTTELGLARFELLDASGYSKQGSATKTRIDAAARLRRAHEAAQHDQWFRKQVELGLDDLKAGRLVTEAEHDAHCATRREALVKRIGKTKKVS